MNKKRTFSLVLSTAELTWLAGALGKMNLFLPGNSVGWPDYQNITATQQSLLRRGMIRQKGDISWEVDRLVVIFIEWVCTPDYFLSIYNCCRDGQEQSAGIYFFQGQGLMLQVQDGSYLFTLYQSRSDLKEVYLSLAGFESFQPAMPAVFDRMTIPDPGQLIPAIWRCPHMGQSILDNAGVQEETIPMILDWVNLQTKLSEITQWDVREGQFRKVNTVVSISDGHQAWSGETEVGKKQIDLVHLHEDVLMERLSRVLSII